MKCQTPCAQGSSSSTSSLHVSTVFGADTKTSALDWSFRDGVYLSTCPNADPGSERLTKSMKILEEINLLDKTVINEFETDDEDRILGCYTSHVSDMQDASKDTQQRRGAEKNMLFQSLLPKETAAVTPFDVRD